jgi:YbbR domain-containing protein
VRRLLGFVVNNWPLKLAAILLATLLYAGLVLSQNSRTWPGPIPINVVNQPTSAFIVGELGNVTNVRYFAPTSVADHVSSAGFSATIDLAHVTVDAAQPVLANVQLKGPDGVNIIDYTPRQIYVQLDPLATRTVPVRVSHGIVPDGLQIGVTQVSQESATVSGPSSVVTQVVAAEARVQIQSSGIDVDQLVDLVPVDGRDEVLSPVEINPTSVRVRIPVGSPVTTKSLPVDVTVTGIPADGFTVGTITPNPPVATVTGEGSTLSGLTTVETAAVDITGASTTVSKSVGLTLPDGVTGVGDQTINVTVTLRPTDSSRNFTAGVVVVGSDPARTYSVAVPNVVVTLGGGDQALNAVDASSFAASVDVSGLGSGQHDVDVHAVAPAGLKIIAISPAQVAVFVGDLATPPPTPTPAPTFPPFSPEPPPSASASLNPTNEGSAAPSESAAAGVGGGDGAAGSGSGAQPSATP